MKKIKNILLFFIFYISYKAIHQEDFYLRVIKNNIVILSEFILRNSFIFADRILVFISY